MKLITIKVKIDTTYLNHEIERKIKDILFDSFWYVDEFEIKIEELTNENSIRINIKDSE